MIDNSAYWKIAGVVSPEDFTTKFHREAFAAIRDAADAGQPFDLVTLSETTHLDLSELATLVNETPGSANVSTYAKIVRDRALLRQASAAIAQSLERINGGDFDAIAELATRLEGLQRSDSPTCDFYEALQAGLQQIETAQIAARESSGIVGAPTGIAALDDRLRGLQGGKLIILAARPSLGKTALSLQAAQAAAAAGFPVGIMSLEMGAGEIAIRAFAHQYQVNNSALAFGDAEDVEALTHKIAANQEHAEQFKRLPIYIDEDTFDVAGILGRITEWHRRYGIKFAIVDHLQLVDLPRDRNRNDGLGDVTRSLKLLAKRLDIPVMLLCQLNRSVDREQRKPKLSDLRDSGNIEQDADIVIGLNGTLDNYSDGTRDIEVGFLKYRGGPVGWGGIMRFNGRTQTFRKGAIGYE